MIPECAEDESDYEVELVVVLGETLKDATPQQAMKAVLGYTLSNDVSARTRMFAVPQWGLGKSFDTWLPLGPCLVSATNPRGISNPDNVHLTTKLNNRVMQDGNTADMLWKTAETLAHLSKGTTLKPGDIVSMGTPQVRDSSVTPKSPSPMEIPATSGVTADWVASSTTSSSADSVFPNPDSNSDTHVL